MKKKVFLFSIFLASSTNQSTLSNPREYSINPLCITSFNSDTIFYPLYLAFCLLVLVVIFPVLKLSIPLSSLSSAYMLIFSGFFWKRLIVMFHGNQVHTHVTYSTLIRQILSESSHRWEIPSISLKVENHS